MLLSNPAWIDQIIRDNWHRLASRVSEDALPRPQPRPRVWRFKEFGVGHYGAVYPTSIPGLVFKITSDLDEARFVQFALNLAKKEGYFPNGLVRYVAVLEIVDARHPRGRPIYALWREEATDFKRPPMSRSYEYREMNRAIDTLMRYKSISHLVKIASMTDPDAIFEAEKYDDRNSYEQAAAIFEDTEKAMRLLRTNAYRLPRARRVAIALRACEFIAQSLWSDSPLSLIGDTLEYYQNAGMLLADVHMANVGMATRPDDYDEPVPVIRDPGHAVPLTPAAKSTYVPVLL